MTESASTITGAEFNARVAGTKMYKLLNRNLKHYGYEYEPNALNDLTKLGETFNPNPDCRAGGLYFCAESDILHWAHMCNDPLIAPVEIPDNSQISIGEHKFKTDKLVLGQPKTFEEFYSDSYIRNMPLSYFHNVCPGDTIVWKLVKKHYLLMLVLNSDKSNKSDKAVESDIHKADHVLGLLKESVLYGDIEFLDFLRNERVVQDVLAKPEIDEQVQKLIGHESASQNVIGWFETHFPQQTELIESLKKWRRPLLWYSN